jgi:hypothetical protein
MSTRYRDLYRAKVKGAIPANEEEAALFDLMREEERHDQLAEAIATIAKLANPKGQVGAPRKTGGDVPLAEKLIAKYNGDVKRARQEFIRNVTERDGCEKKRARERFKDALRGKKDPKTGSGF